MLDQLRKIEPIRLLGGALGALALLLMVFLLGRCDGTRREAARQEASRLEAVNKAERVNTKALEKAASERATDTATIGNHTEGLTNATHAVPDSRPDAARVALGCQRLRNQGRSGADLPAECRPPR